MCLNSVLLEKNPPETWKIQFSDFLYTKLLTRVPSFGLADRVSGLEARVRGFKTREGLKLCVGEAKQKRSVFLHLLLRQIVYP